MFIDFTTREVWRGHWLVFPLLIRLISSASEVELPTVAIPSQGPPPPITIPSKKTLSAGIGNDTNLLSLLEEIQEKSSAGLLDEAQNLASEALEIEDTDSSRFYLRQIRKEETRLFARANQAMKEKTFH